MNNKLTEDDLNVILSYVDGYEPDDHEVEKLRSFRSKYKSKHESIYRGETVTLKFLEHIQSGRSHQIDSLSWTSSIESAEYFSKSGSGEFGIIWTINEGYDICVDLYSLINDPTNQDLVNGYHRRDELIPLIKFERELILISPVKVTAKNIFKVFKR